MKAQENLSMENETLVNQKNKEIRGLIFDIQGHSVHDGPGTRTTVFLSGCPLNCIWCCNPEGLFHHPVMMHKESKCKHCGKCIAACPYGAISIKDNQLVHNRDLCDVCTTFECVEACLQEAKELNGEYYSVNDLMSVLKRDRQFWGSRGGVTFSGGEPLLQKDFILEMTQRCKQSFIHVAVETTACLSTEHFMNVMNNVDWVFVDVKHMNTENHRKLTGVGNELILKNIKTLAEKPDWNGFIVPRIPIIPGKNDSEENIRATAKFIKEIDLEVINILPFHRLGESKYRQIGRRYKFEDQVPPSEEHMIKIKRMIEDEDLVCFVGYETPF